MNCDGCKNTFNRFQRLPKLLIKCGHSICKICLENDFSQGQIKCPKCNQINYAELPRDFPQNLTLLDLTETNINSTILSLKYAHSEKFSHKDLQEKYNIDKNFPFEVRSFTTISKKSGKSIGKINENCKEHNKNYEVYCFNDNSLLCVQCLLKKEHKQHRVYNIEESYNKLKDQFLKRVSDFGIKKNFIIDNYKEVFSNSFINLKENHDYSMKKIEIQYKKIINIVNKSKSRIINGLM